MRHERYFLLEIVGFKDGQHEVTFVNPDDFDEAFALKIVGILDWTTMVCCIDLQKRKWKLAAPNTEWRAHSVVPHSCPDELKELRKARGTCVRVMLIAQALQARYPIPNAVWRNIVLPHVVGKGIAKLVTGGPLVREFLALFVIDPAYKLQEMEQLERAEDGFVSTFTREAAGQARQYVLDAQLRGRPMGKFAVVSTGNGDCHQLNWQDDPSQPRIHTVPDCFVRVSSREASDFLPDGDQFSDGWVDAVWDWKDENKNLESNPNQ